MSDKYDQAQVLAKVEMRHKVRLQDFAVRSVCECGHFKSDHIHTGAHECKICPHCHDFRFRGFIAAGE